jgi:hypothetical protein
MLSVSGRVPSTVGAAEVSANADDGPRASIWRRVLDEVRYGTPEAREQMRRLAVERRAGIGAEPTTRSASVPLSRSERRGFVALIALGIALWVASGVIPFPLVTAVRVEATVLTNETIAGCENNGLTVRFAWHGRPVTEGDGLQPCNHAYRAGEQIVIYVASNEPSDTGNTAQSILNPTGVGFQDIGPNDDPSLLQGLGLVLGLGGAIALVLDWRRRRRGKAAPSTQSQAAVR